MSADPVCLVHPQYCEDVDDRERAERQPGPLSTLSRMLYAFASRTACVQRNKKHADLPLKGVGS